MGKDLNFGAELPLQNTDFLGVPSTPAKGKRSAISCYFGPLFYYMQFCIEGQKLFFQINRKTHRGGIGEFSCLATSASASYVAQ